MSGSIEKYAFKDGTSRWSIRYRVNGQQKRERGFPTRQIAEKALRDRLVAIDKQQYVDRSEETFAEYATGWLDRQEAQLKPSTRHSYARNLRIHVLPRVGHVKLQSIDALMLNGLWAQLLRSGRADGEDGGLSPTTVRYIATIVGAVLADAARMGVILRDPSKLATPPRPVKDKELQFWTAAQARAFLQSTRSDRLYPLWRMLLHTGFRRGEALGLTWDRVDLDEGTATVARSLVDVDWGQPVFSTPKTSSGRRTVALDEDTVEVLRRWRSVQASERLVAGASWKDHGLVFTHSDGGPHHPDRVSRSFTDAVRRAGLPHVRLHDLRHCHATLLLAAGVQPHVVQRRLGHAHVSITLGLYAHVLPHQDEEAAEAMAKVMSR